MSAHEFLSARLGHAKRVVSTMPGEARIASGAVAFIALVSGVMYVDWRIGILIALALSVTMVLRINTALDAGAPGHGELDSIERVLLEDGAVYPAAVLGFEDGWNRALRFASALRARSRNRFGKPTEPVAHAAP